jgi:hypothetical protein
MIADRKKFIRGVVLLVAFAGVLVVIFSPVFNGQNGLEYFDDLYNSISKDSAYYIEDLREDSEVYVGEHIEVILEMEDVEQAEQTALLYTTSGAEAVASGIELEISGDLGAILSSVLEDSDSMYFDEGDKVREKYGVEEEQRVLYNWWTSFEEMEAAFQDEGMHDEAKDITSIREKAIEPSYNYYGIEPESIGDRIGIVVFSLIFYVVYTVWYGFGVMYLFEGFGIRVGH